MLSLPLCCQAELTVHIPMPPIPTPAIERSLVPKLDVTSEPRCAGMVGTPIPIRWFNCGGVRFEVVSTMPSFDFVQAVCTAYRSAKFVEVWRTMSGGGVERLEANLGSSFTYRDTVITGLMRATEVAFTKRPFSTTVSALIDAGGVDEGIVGLKSQIGQTLAEGIRSLRFTPDLVVTFVGSDPLRIEFEFRTGRTPIQTKTGWEFTTLDRRRIESLRDLSETLTIPTNPAVVPAVYAAGIPMM